MKTWSVLFAILMLVTNAAFAAYDPDEDPEYTRKGTSRDNRADKSFSFLAQPVGVGPSGVFSSGLHFAFFIDADSQILLDYGYGSMNDQWLNHSQVKASNVGVYYKHFVSNSFYLKAGIDHRLVDYSFRSISFWRHARFCELSGELHRTRICARQSMAI